MPLYLGADLRERWNGQEGDRTATAIPRWNQFRYSEPVAVCAGFGSFLFFLQHPQSTWLGCLCQCLWPRLWLLCSESTSGYLLVATCCLATKLRLCPGGRDAPQGLGRRASLSSFWGQFNQTYRLRFSLFESGINWGRVIALLGFGYCMAIHVYQHGITGFLRRIARYVTEFMLRNRIAQWIAQQGGWVSQGGHGLCPGGPGGQWEADGLRSAAEVGGASSVGRAGGRPRQGAGRSNAP